MTLKRGEGLCKTLAASLSLGYGNGSLVCSVAVQLLSNDDSR